MKEPSDPPLLTISGLVSDRTVNFQGAFLHPKYWLLWTGLGILWLTCHLLSYRAMLWLGKKLGRMLLYIFNSRRKIVSRNLELCFPGMSQWERQKLLVRNFESIGISIFEIAIAWWWPDHKIEKLLTFKGFEHIEQAEKEGRGLVIFSLHSLNLEIGARLFGLEKKGIGIYRPHNNPVMEYVQVIGRSRSHKGLFSKYKLKSAIRAFIEGELLWYSADQDFGRDSASFVPLFAVKEAATITGGSTLCRLSKASMVPFYVIRNEDGSGYTLEIYPPVKGYPSGDDQYDAVLANQAVEIGILKAPDQYMWLHRRFKTRPNSGDPSLYEFL